MKRKISIILMIVSVAALSMLAFTACNEDRFYGTYVSNDNRNITLELKEDGKAVFGSVDDTKEYFVNFGSDKIGINTDDFKCYWGEFTYTFLISETVDGITLTLKGYDSSNSDAAVDIVFEKQPYVVPNEEE